MTETEIISIAPDSSHPDLGGVVRTDEGTFHEPSTIHAFTPADINQHSMHPDAPPIASDNSNHASAAEDVNTRAVPRPDGCPPPVLESSSGSDVNTNAHAIIPSSPYSTHALISHDVIAQQPQADSEARASANGKLDTHAAKGADSDSEGVIGDYPDAGDVEDTEPAISDRDRTITATHPLLSWVGIKLASKDITAELVRPVLLMWKMPLFRAWLKSIPSILWRLLKSIPSILRGLQHSIACLFRGLHQIISSLYARWRPSLQYRLCVALQPTFVENPPAFRVLIIAMTLLFMILILVPFTILSLSLLYSSLLLSQWPLKAIAPSMETFSWNFEDESELRTYTFLRQKLDRHHLRTRIITMFYVEPNQEVYSTLIILGFIFGFIFAGVHFTVWPSLYLHATTLVCVTWLLSSISGMLPFIAIVFIVIARFIHPITNHMGRSQVLNERFLINNGSFYLLLSRFPIVVISVTSLRALSSSALGTVPWIENVPHI